MTAIFVSHRSSDNAEAQSLKDWLAQQGHEQLFLDFDPADGIPAGVDWEQRLYQELRRCQALLIVLTPAWLESKWCGNELAIAREKGKAVFIVRVAACAGGPVIPAIQEVDLTVDREAALTKLARGLKEHGLDPASAFDWRPGRPIYPGLTAFDVEDAAIFFGRSEESWQAVEALRRLRLQATGSAKLLLITGASGSGKSSLMRAGVLARLRKEPASWIVARPVRRGGDALGSLAEGIAWAFPPDRRPTSLAALTAGLSGQDGAAQLLMLARELRLALDRPEATLVLALDQAEELLTAEQTGDAARLLDLFRATLARVGNEVLVLATIRSDRLGGWQQHTSIKATAEHGELPFEMLPLGPMPMARIGEIVRGPAAYEGLRIDDELVDAIRADTVTPDALPLLAYTLQYLHRHFGEDGRLTLAEYQSFDGLEGSVRNQADAAIPIDRLSEAERQALREAFVPGLVRATAEGGFSRSRALLATLPPLAEPHLRRLTDDARLLLTDRDPQGGVTVEVAHEALLRVWPALARWIADDAQDLRRLEALQRAAADWAQNGRGQDFLSHRDHRLAEAEALIAEPRFASRLDAPDRDYLGACRNAQNEREADEKEARERELRAAQTLARRTITGLVVVSMLAAAALGSGWWALTQKNEAQRQLNLANDALATGLWNDLDFAQVDVLAPAERKALWTLTMDDGLVRAPFVAELATDLERMQRFARRPEAVARALGLRWPSPADAPATFSQLLKAITEARDAERLAALAQATRPLAGHLDAEQAQAALVSTLGTLADSNDPWKLLTLAQVVQALPVRLTVDQADAALEPIIDMLARATGASRVSVAPGGVSALARAAQSLAGTLSDKQALAVLDRLLTLMAGKPNAPELRALAEAVHALPVSLTFEQADKARTFILSTVVTEATEPDEMVALARAVQTLPTPLTDAEARETITKLSTLVAGKVDASEEWELAFAELVQSLGTKLTVEQASDAFNPVLSAIIHATWAQGTADDGQPRALAAMAQALSAKLTNKQKGDAFHSVLVALENTTELDKFWGWIWAARGLAQTLSVEQIRAESAPVLTTLATSPEIWRLKMLAQALSVPLTAEQARDALAAIESAADSDRLREVAQAGQELLGKRTAREGADAHTQVLDAIRAGTEIVQSDVLWLLAQTTQVVAMQLTDEQAHDAMAATLEGLRATADGSESEALSLAEAAQALPVQLTDKQAREALGSLLDAMKNETYRGSLEALSQAFRALAGKLTAEQASVEVGWLLDTLGATTDPAHSDLLVQAMQALALRLTAEQVQAGLADVQPRFAWASSTDEALSWSRALVTLLARVEPQFAVAGIVEALKYPTAAGAPTDVLLDALHSADPTAPGKEARVAGNLAWLSAAYPTISADTHPACPWAQSDQQGLACSIPSA